MNEEKIITWNQQMINSQGELIGDVGLFELLDFKWAIVAAYDHEGVKHLIISHYKTGIPTGFHISIAEMRFIIPRFRDWINYKDRIDDVEAKIANLPEQN